MSGREVFFRVFFVGGVILLIIALVEANWVAATWACVSLLGSSASIAIDRSNRRADQ